MAAKNLQARFYSKTSPLRMLKPTILQINGNFQISHY